ncbi:hypothetical protein [Seonamhaeicola marinus]|uniref:Uncharacterized protein n=1 Tax=Seonamhaeicola marinus TaxID=1912246 RepID=A0A5D0HKK1_9FLAO|nr:hypothetical protein [Seonamhaeicola marinus]TYA71490.1 hypothetical protein FUA24_18085 [Seonamhaeicola marinus]
MKSLKPTFDKVLFTAFLVLVIWVIYGSVADNDLISKSVYPLFIPVFLIFFFLNNKNLNIGFVIFLIFCFLSDISSIFFQDDWYVKISSSLTVLGFTCLFLMMLPKLQFGKLGRLIRGYLVMVFCISLYFLYTVGYELNLIISDTNEMVLFSLKNLTLIVFAFVAFANYLSKENTISVLVLIGAILINLSSILGYVNLYYVYHWSFEMIDKLLYVTCLYFLFRSFAFEKRYQNLEKDSFSVDKRFTSKEKMLA